MNSSNFKPVVATQHLLRNFIDVRKKQIRNSRLIIVMGEGRMGLDWMDQGPNGKTKRWTTHNHNRGSVTKRSVEAKLSCQIGFSFSLVHFHGTNSLHLSNR